MKPSQLVRLLLILPLLLVDALHAETTLLPGVTYFEGHEPLAGKLTFLLSQDATLKSNSISSASIYEFDLSEKKLRKVTDAPNGLFVPSDSRGLFCVIFRPGDWYHGDDTNVFIYSDAIRKSRVLTLESPAKETQVLAGHAFFVVERTNGSALIDYDIARDEQHQVKLPDAGEWQYQHYDRIHIPRGQTNVLHFYYKGFGNQQEGGKDYRDGYYSLDVASGGIRWFAELLNDEDDGARTYQASDGRYVYFEGPDAPFRGFKLMSSPWDFQESKNQDSKGKRAKVLKGFSRLFGGGSNAFMVSQMSPDGRYVLVRLQEPSVPKSTMQPGWINTYFLVDASDGQSRVLLKDEVKHTTDGSMSALRWIR